MDNQKFDPRKVFEAKLVELGKVHPNLVGVSCDSASGGGLSGFFSAFPDRKVEVGINEQNAVSMCAAMSRQNLIPLLVIINPFLTMRAYEQIRDDLGYVSSNVKIVGSGGGLAYSTLGASHIAIEDVALMRTIPNLTVLCPGDAVEIETALEQALEINGPVYIRMPRQARELLAQRECRNIQIGKAETLINGHDVALLAYGPSAGEAVKAAEILKDEGIHISVVDFMTLKPFDAEAIIELCSTHDHLVTLEEHIQTGGLGSVTAEVMALNDCRSHLHILSIPDGSKQTGPYNELLDYYNLSAKKVAHFVRNLSIK